MALGILYGLERGPEYFVVGILRDFIDDNFPPVVGNLEDDELGLSPAHAEVIEGGDAFIIDCDSVNVRNGCVSVNIHSSVCCG